MQMKINILTIIIGVVVVVMWSCKNNSSNPLGPVNSSGVAALEQYYPLAVGNWWSYSGEDVDSTGALYPGSAYVYTDSLVGTTTIAGTACFAMRMSNSGSALYRPYTRYELLGVRCAGRPYHIRRYDGAFAGIMDSVPTPGRIGCRRNGNVLRALDKHHREQWCCRYHPRDRHERVRLSGKRFNHRSRGNILGENHQTIFAGRRQYLCILRIPCGGCRDCEKPIGRCNVYLQRQFCNAI